MKKVIFSLIMILIPLSHMAQQAGDIFTIKIKHYHYMLIFSI